MERTFKGLALALVLGLASTAQAGEVLRLKAGGAFRTQAQSLATEAETGLYIMQWQGQVLEAEKEALKALGLEFLSYVPEDAFLVAGTREQAARAMDLGFLRTALPFHAGLKLDPELNRHGIFSFSDTVNVSVQTKETVSSDDLRPYFRAIKTASKGFFVGQTSLAKVWELAARGDVLWIERFLPIQSMDLNAEELFGVSVETVRANESKTGFESGAKIMNVDAAYAAGFTGAGQIAAFADTGLDKGDLNTLIPDFQGQVKSAYAMGLGGKSWGDPQNHGTHVAGSIAGNGKSSAGLIKGAGFGAKLVAEGLWSEILNNLSIPGIPQLFDRAYKDGARIHSNSWGAPNSNGRYDNFTVAADKWLWDNMDFLAVFASGNDGGDMNKDGVIDEGTVSSPGSAKNVLTVGASKNYLLEGGIQAKLIELRVGKEKWGVEPLASSKLSEDARGMAAFSSRGPTQDGRIKPEIVAPGTNIVSARNTHPKAKPQDSWGIYNDHYLFMGGTSMSTPLTNSALAVVRQYLNKKLGTDAISGALLKATIANTATDLFPGQFGLRERGQEQPSRRPNNHQGWGLVNLAALVDNSAIQFVDERKGLATGAEMQWKLAVSDTTKPLKVTMAYTDAPATAAAAKTLVNDLDLVVVDPTGKEFFPNGKNTKDSTNNMEQVDVLKPVTGEYVIRVKAANVPQGKGGAQPFALVINNGN